MESMKFCCTTLTLLCALLNAGTGMASVPKESERCISEAAQYHGVHPGVLRAILKVESGMNPNAVNRNDNGTKDVGIGQINSIHFRELAGYGIQPQHLLDACAGTYVSAWFLKQKMQQHGNTWKGLAAYHSVTPEFNQRYAQKLYKQLVRDGWIEGAVNSSEPKNEASSVQKPKSQKAQRSSKNQDRMREKMHSPMLVEVDG